MRIHGGLVLITGASSGIGAATARAVAQAGGRVVLMARNAAALEGVAAEVRALGGQAWVQAVDLAQPEAVQAAARQVMAEAGPPDVLILSAGAGRWLAVEETPPAEAAAMMAAPYFAAFYTVQAFLPAMLQRGSGHIVTINSPASRLVWPGATGYVAARWALRGFTQALRADLRGTGLRVTQVVPGLVLSPYFEHNPGAWARIPKIGRLLVPAVTPEQVARAIVWAVAHDWDEHVIPFMLRVFYVLHSLAPWLVEWLLQVTGWRHAQPQESEPR